MRVAPSSPLKPVLIPYRTRAGHARVVVVCKLTFALEPGASRLAPQQDPPTERDQHIAGDAGPVLHAPSDFVPGRADVDVVLVGHAFAPRGAPVARLRARLAFGAVDKSLDVFGDRLVDRAGAIVEARPFAAMSVGYERAAGGLSTWNPVGIPVNGPPDAGGLRRLPNLQHLEGLPDLGGGAPFALEPVAFGPVPRSWRPRRAEVGGFDPDAEAFPAKPLRDDLHGAYFNCALPDQRTPRADGETLALENLHRAHASLTTKLVAGQPRAFVDRGGRRDEVPLRADTLFIDTDRGVATLTYRGTIARELELEPARGADLDAGDVYAYLDDDAPRPSMRRRATAGVWPVESARTGAAAVAVAVAVPITAALEPAEPVVLGDLALAGDDGQSTTAVFARGAPSVDASPTTRRAPLVEAPATAPMTALVWCDVERVSRLRGSRAWATLLAGANAPLADRAHDDEGLGLDHDARRDAARHDALAAMRTGEPVGASAARDELRAALRAGRADAPVLLLEGELAPRLDDRALLEATLAIAGHYAKAGSRLHDALEAARDATTAPGAELVPGLAARSVALVREAFAADVKGVTAGLLETQGARATLARRAFARIPVLGAAHVPAALEAARGGAALVVYVPEAAAAELPLFARFRAKVLAEVHPQLDELEPGELALRAVAIGRVLTGA